MQAAAYDSLSSDDNYPMIAERFEAMSRLMAVALVNPTNRLVLSLNYIEYRQATTRSITPAYDVVVIYGPNSAPLVRRLFQRLGKETPPVLVIAPTVDHDDVRAAIAYGATSYLIDDTTRRYAGEAVVKTSAGLRCLDPMVDGALFESGHEGAVVVAPRPEVASDAPSGAGVLTPRETQIMQLIATGYSAAEVASQLRLKEHAVRNNLTNIYAKLQVRRQSEAVMLWLGHQPAPPGPRHGLERMTRPHARDVSMLR